MSLATTVSTTPLAPGLELSVHADGPATVLALRGEADVATLAALVEALARITADGSGDVLVDLSRIDFMDTATVRAVLGARDVLAGDGRRLTFRSPSRVAGRILAVFGLTHLVIPPVMAPR